MVPPVWKNQRALPGLESSATMSPVAVPANRIQGDYHPDFNVMVKSYRVFSSGPLLSLSANRTVTDRDELGPRSLPVQ
jgi:hypothetical protein